MLVGRLYSNVRTYKLRSFSYETDMTKCDDAPVYNIYVSIDRMELFYAVLSLVMYDLLVYCTYVYVSPASRQD